MTVRGPHPALKILTLSWEFPPRIIGGISAHVYHLSRTLARNGDVVHVVTCDFPGAKAQDVIDGVHVYRVDTTRISQTDFLFWIYCLNSLMIDQAEKILGSESFDLIHAHDWLVGRAALELKKRYAIPLVTTVHATEIGRARGIHSSYQKTIHNIERLLVESSERIICCSMFMVDHICRNFSPKPEKIDLIPNAVDPKQFGNGSEGSVADILSAEDSQSEKRVLYVGRIVQEKGLHTLIDAFDKLQQKINANLVIVGEGPLRESLMMETRNRGLDGRVRFTGRVSETSLVKLYRTSHVFVLPSLYEPFGIAALEAMASRLPVVVSDSGGLSEIVENGVTGIKVPVQDSDSLAQALFSILKDSSLAEALSKNAYQILLDRYSWELVADKTQQTYGRARSEFEGPSSMNDKDFLIDAGPSTMNDEDFLTNAGLMGVLLTAGASRQETAKTAAEIAASIRAPATSVKLALGRLASQGYVSGLTTHGSMTVSYHLTENGIIKACSMFS